ncbi:MAG: ABC transporter permease [Acidimicrobiia bacterium]
MRASLLVSRAELRRRLGSLVVVALLVAVMVGAVATALAGARRTATSVERFRSWAHASDGFLQLDDPSQITGLRRELRASGLVEQSTSRLLVNAFLEHRPITDIAIYSDRSGQFGRTLDRARVLRGRIPRAGENDAIALSDLAADLLHVGPGAVLSTRTWSTKDLEALFGDQGFPGFHGPHLRLRVVGVIRTLGGLTADVERASPYGLVAPGFTTAHPTIGVWPPAVYVRTRSGTGGFEALGRYLRTHGPHTTGTSAADLYLDSAQHAADDSATGLVVFAIAAALAGAFAVGQAIQRHLLLGATNLRYLVDLGMTRTQVATIASVPVVGATAIGIGLGVVAAVLLSSILPIGLAGRAEVAPGIRVDVPILLGCAAAAVVLVAGFSLLTARRTVARVRGSIVTGRRASVLTQLASRSGLRPATTTGIHLATERQAPDGPVPVRSALAVVVLAVVAVIGVSVVVHSESDFVSDPARWGRTWSSEPDAFGANSSQEAVAKAAVSDPGVAAVAVLTSDGVRVNGRDVPVTTLTPVHGRLVPAVRTGTLPRRVDQIAIGQGTLDKIGAHVGGTVRVQGHNGDQPGLAQTMTVTGTIVTPPSAGSSGVLDTGVVVTPAALRALIPPDQVASDIVLRFRRGADVAAVKRRLSRHGLDFNLFTEAQTPGVVRRLADTRTIAVALGWFFAVLGLLGLLHALWVASRRHRRDFAVLRVIGMRRGQIARSVVMSALLLTTIAVVVGIPVGIVAGRLVWRGSTESLHALTDPATPWLTVLLAVPVTLALGVVLAAWPAHRAGHADLAEALRTE